jgi:hypothetical protein
LAKRLLFILRNKKTFAPYQGVAGLALRIKPIFARIRAGQADGSKIDAAPVFFPVAVSRGFKAVLAPANFPFILCLWFFNLGILNRGTGLCVWRSLFVFIVCHEYTKALPNIVPQYTAMKPCSTSPIDLTHLFYRQVPANNRGILRLKRLICLESVFLHSNRLDQALVSVSQHSWSGNRAMDGSDVDIGISHRPCYRHHLPGYKEAALRSHRNSP